MLIETIFIDIVIIYFNNFDREGLGGPVCYIQLACDL